MRVSLCGDRTVRAGTVVATVTVELAPNDEQRDLDNDLVPVAVELHTACTKGLHVAMDLCRHAPQLTVSASEHDPQPVPLSAAAERGARDAAQHGRYRPRDPVYVTAHLRALLASAIANAWVQA